MWDGTWVSKHNFVLAIDNIKVWHKAPLQPGKRHGMKDCMLSTLVGSAMLCTERLCWTWRNCVLTRLVSSVNPTALFLGFPHPIHLNAGMKHWSTLCPSPLIRLPSHRLWSTFSVWPHIADECHGGESVLNWQSLRLTTNCPIFMEPECSLPCSQQLAVGCYSPVKIGSLDDLMLQ